MGEGPKRDGIAEKPAECCNCQELNAGWSTQGMRLATPVRQGRAGPEGTTRAGTTVSEVGVRQDRPRAADCRSQGAAGSQARALSDQRW